MRESRVGPFDHAFRSSALVVIASYRRSKSRRLSFFLREPQRQVGLTTSLQPLPGEFPAELPRVGQYRAQRFSKRQPRRRSPIASLTGHAFSRRECEMAREARWEEISKWLESFRRSFQWVAPGFFQSRREEGEGEGFIFAAWVFQWSADFGER